VNRDFKISLLLIGFFALMVKDYVSFCHHVVSVHHKLFTFKSALKSLN